MRLEFPIDSPLKIGYDQNTGLVSVVAIAEMGNPLTPNFPMELRLLLSPETSRGLLGSLPALEAILRQASEWKAKPDSVQ